MDEIRYHLIGILVAATLVFLYRRAHKTVHFEATTATALLRYPSWFKIIILLCLILAAFMLGVAFTSSDLEPREWAMVLTVGLFFLIGAFSLMIEVRKRIYLSPETIRSESPWTGSIESDWNSIKSVKFSSVNSWFVIETPAGKIRATIFMEGSKSLVAFLKTCTNSDVHSKAIARLESCGFVKQDPS